MWNPYTSREKYSLLLQTLLEVQDGIGQKKLQASGLAKSSWDEMEAAVSALSPSVFVMMLTVVRRSVYCYMYCWVPLSVQSSV